jgi:peptidoglycan DL-endopeptidase CwlO
MKNIKRFPCYFPRDSKNIVKVNTWWLRDEAADAFGSMRNAYQALFPGLKFLITSAGRTHDQQIVLYKQKPGLAARPGNSWHESGCAADLAISIMKAQCGWTQEEFQDFALKFGFHRTVAREPWHFEFHSDAIPRTNAMQKASIKYIGND